MQLAAILVALVTKIQAICKYLATYLTCILAHGHYDHIAHVDWSDLTNTAQQDAATALTEADELEAAKKIAATELVTAKAEDNSALVTDAECRLLHE